jgi:transposase
MVNFYEELSKSDISFDILRRSTYVLYRRSSRRSTANDRNRVPNAGDKALLEMRLKQDVVHACNHGPSGDIFIGMARDENNWREEAMTPQTICKGGMTTKILALTDALGNLVRFVLLPGHRFDTVGVAPLIDGLTFEGFIADKAFDSNSIIADLNERRTKIVISQHPRRASPLPIDAEIYKWRHLIENFFCKLKEFKRIAMRADKTDQSFAANILLAAAVINSR